jgi:branched-chain amino acid transport system substrate-binding protein
LSDWSSSAAGTGAVRRVGRLAVFAIALTIAVSACGGGEDERPANQQAAGGCKAEGGDIQVFQSADVSGTAGENLGPASVRASELWVKKLNAEGGVRGCTIRLAVEDDAFDPATCLRNYRNALASRKYDVFIGPSNSACMVALPELTNAAKKPLISGVAADEQPFLNKFTPYVFQGSVTTLLEGRAAAVFANDNGWKRAALIVPNFAYGQDVGKAFRQYLTRISPDTTVVAEQSPELTERNFTPFINAVVAKNPDGVFSAFFGPFALPFLKQWNVGDRGETQLIGGLLVLDTFLGLKSAADIPENLSGFDRGYPPLMARTAVGKEFIERWTRQYGDDPGPSEFAFQLLGSWQLMRALIEKTGNADPDEWKAAVEAGDFKFESPYREGATYVHPVNHMADNCESVAPVTFEKQRTPSAGYDVDALKLVCLSDVLDAAESTKLTQNPDVAGAAVQKFYEAAQQDD